MFNLDIRPIFYGTLTLIVCSIIFNLPQFLYYFMFEEIENVNAELPFARIIFTSLTLMMMFVFVILKRATKSIVLSYFITVIVAIVIGISCGFGIQFSNPDAPILEGVLILSGISTATTVMVIGVMAAFNSVKPASQDEAKESFILDN